MALSELNLPGGLPEIIGAILKNPAALSTIMSLFSGLSGVGGTAGAPVAEGGGGGGFDMSSLLGLLPLLSGLGGGIAPQNVPASTEATERPQPPPPHLEREQPVFAPSHIAPDGEARTVLLHALTPYLRPERRDTLDKIIKITELLRMFNSPHAQLGAGRDTG